MVRSCRNVCLNWLLSTGIAACYVVPAYAQDTIWTGDVDTDFFTDGNWTNTAPDTILEYGVIDSTDVNHLAIIDASTGTVTLDGVNLGETLGGANVIQNGGTLNFDAFTTTKIGGNGPNPSTWVMNNDSVILYDGPLNGGGGGYGFDGANGSDFDVGNGPSEATLELHDTAILRIADDLKISDNGSPVGGHVLLDGDSQITVGSGTSLGTSGPGTLTIAGNALYVSGNSAGPGNTAQGYTNEGYFAPDRGTVVVKDNGRFWIRTIQARGGETNITVQDNARFDIFDVFNHASPTLGTSTVVGSVNGSERTSEVSEGPGSKMVLTIKNNGIMTVDSDIADSTWSGLALSGGSNRGGNGGGGETMVDIQDQGSFTVQQNLNMTMGTDAAAKSTLKVTGPDASVTINGDLRMALDPSGAQNPGTATIHAVITADMHTTIDVGGSFNINNADLVVELNGYVPTGGESYELINAGSIIGTAFENEDFTLASLLPDLSWEVSLMGSSVFLNVLGSAGIPGDYNNDGVVDAADYTRWRDNLGAPADTLPNDTDGGPIGPLQYTTWKAHFGESINDAALSPASVPEPFAIVLLLLGLSVGCRAARDH